MSAQDRNRLNLYQKLDEILGTEEANTLMEHLPPIPWNEVATKGDVEASEVALKADIETMTTTLRIEMAAMGKDIRHEMAAMGRDIRGELAAMGKEIRGEMQGFRTELKADIHVLGAELRAEMLSGFNRQIKWLVTFGVAWSSLLIAITRFTP